MSYEKWFDKVVGFRGNDIVTCNGCSDKVMIRNLALYGNDNYCKNCEKNIIIKDMIEHLKKCYI